MLAARFVRTARHAIAGARTSSPPRAAEKFVMTRKMLIDAAHAEETRVVVLDGNRVEEFDFESQTRKQLRGNIYLAKVTRVEPSLQAAFVEYGAWLARSPIPKLLITADPGQTAERVLNVARSWPNSREVSVKGIHRLPEDSPHEIGRALREFVEVVR